MSAGREGGWYHRSPAGPASRDRATTPRATRHTLPVTAILGGLAAAVLWSAATLCSSRSSRMLGSLRRARLGHGRSGRVVGLPLAIVTPLPASFDPFVFVLLLVAGLCYCLGLMLAYMALTIGKVSIVAPIVATEGAVAARHRDRARRHGRPGWRASRSR